MHEGGKPLTWDLVVCPRDRAKRQVGGVAESVMTGVLVYGETDGRGVSEWAASAWSEAGGAVLEVPAYVAPLNYWQSVDVRSGRWVEDALIFTGRHT